MMFHQRNKKDVAVRTRSKAFTWGRHAQPNYCAKLLKPAEPDEVLLSCIIDDPSGHSRRRKTLSPRSCRGMTRLSPEYSVILFAASALRRQAGADAVRFPWVLAGVSNTRSRSTSLANLPTTGRDGGATNLKSECKTTRVSLRDAPHNAHRANNRVNNFINGVPRISAVAIKATIGPRLSHSKKRQTKQSKARGEGPLGSWSGSAK